MSGSSAVANPLQAPDLLSPEGIHEYLLRAHRISNELRFKFIEALRALDEGRFFSSLGFPTMSAYAEQFFGWERSRAYDAPTRQTPSRTRRLASCRSVIASAMPAAGAEGTRRFADGRDEDHLGDAPQGGSPGF